MNSTNLTSLQKNVLGALRSLCTDHEPQDSGGFDADDIAYRMAELAEKKVFLDESTACNRTCYELQENGLVQEIEPPFGAAWDTHWKLTA